MTEPFRPGHVVELAPYAVAHADKFAAWYYDYEYRFFFRHFSQTFQADDFKTLGDAMEHAGSPLVIILDKALQTPIGAMTYSLEKSSSRIYKFGIMMDRDTQHKTWAIEAIIILADHLFTKRKAHKLAVEFCDQDAHIHRITAKGGFNHDATLKEELFMDGVFMDEARYSLHEDDYRRLYGDYLDSVAT